jgi:uncharacterized protein with PIN domain
VHGAPPNASIRFYAELNDHLPEAKQYRTLEKPLTTPTTAKDLIESFGVPHTEVDLVLVNGMSVGFAQLVQPGDRVSVYPVFEAFDIATELRVRPEPLRETRFILDVHLGKLAAYLRMLGFDARYQSCFTDADLARISAEEHRTLLTRDRELLKRGQVSHGYWLRQTESRRQTAEILDRFDLASAIQPFMRCMACNSLLEDVRKDQVGERIPPLVAELHNEFRQCRRCGRVYWKGSHYRRMEAWIQELISEPRLDEPVR